MGRLFRIAHYTLQLEITMDNELKTEIMYNLSRECNHSVVLRVSWFTRLAQFYQSVRSNKNSSGL